MACRQGGSFIRRAVRHAVGVDLARASALGSVGLAHLELANRHPARGTGWLSFTAGAVPDQTVLGSVPGVVDFVRRPRTADADSSADFNAALLLEGSGQAQVTHRLSGLDAWASRRQQDTVS